MRDELEQLNQTIRSIEQRHFLAGAGGALAGAGGPVVIPTGWESIDEEVGGGMQRGMVHEWFGAAGAPLAILIQLACRALGGDEPGDKASAARPVLWIGRECWPYPLALNGQGNRVLLRRSIFVDPPDNASRLWAIDQAFRSRAVAAVIADGQGVTMPHSRRLQLAAEVGGGLSLLVRPVKEMDVLSASGTRWLVRPMPSPLFKPRWIVELLRCRGRLPASHAQRRWAMELNRATGRVGFPAVVGDRSGAAPRSAPPRSPHAPLVCPLDDIDRRKSA